MADRGDAAAAGGIRSQSASTRRTNFSGGSFMAEPRTFSTISDAHAAPLTGLGADSLATRLLSTDKDWNADPDKPEGPAMHSTAAANMRATFRSTAVLTVGLALLADYLLLTVIIPIIPELLPPQDVQPLLIGIMFSSKPAAQFLANPFVGSLVDRYGGRSVMFVGSLIAVASTAGFMLSTEYWEMLTCRTIQGVASSAAMSGGMALLSSLHPPDVRGDATGKAMGGLALGVLSGPSLSGLMFTYFGHDGPFGFVLIMLIVATVAQLYLYCREQRLAELGVLKVFSDDDPPPKISELLGDQYMLRLALGVCVASAALAELEPLVPRMLQQDYGMTPGTTGVVFSAMPFAYLVGTPLAGKWSDKVPRWRLVMVGLMLMAISMPGIWVAVVLSGSASSSFADVPEAVGLPVIVAVLAVTGVGMAFIDAPAMPLCADIVEYRGLHHFGTAFALIDMATNLGFIIGPIGGTALLHIPCSVPESIALFGGLQLAVLPIVVKLSNVGRSDVKEEQDERYNSQSESELTGVL